MAYQSFEDLEVWKRGCRQAVTVCRALDDSKNYTFKDQMQRAALSVPSNIAEGHERDSKLDFRRFLRIAKGSNAELRTQIYIALELGLLNKSETKPILAECREISAMLQGLIRSLDSRKAAAEN